MLFDREDDDYGSDVATRSLSVAVVETDFVAEVYKKQASWYDYWFGPTLHHGRLVAMNRIGFEPGDQVLEVGVGTGINLALYPRTVHLTGVDLSAQMLKKAHARAIRNNVHNVRLLEMDAAHLTFPDDSFDIVYAPYLISVVPDPIQVVREMKRVCRPGGKIVIVNHFRSANPILASIERAMSPFTVHLGFKSDLDLPGFLAQADLQPISIEKVNFPRLWSLVTCRKAG